MHMYICMYVCVCVCLTVFVCVCMYTCVSLCTHLYMWYTYVTIYNGHRHCPALSTSFHLLPPPPHK